MLPIRNSLPFPPVAEIVSSLDRKLQLSARQRVKLLLDQRSDVARRLAQLDADIHRVMHEEDLCGPNNLQDVELYDGTRGVTKAFVDEYQPPVGQLQWLPNLAGQFSNPGDSPGNVAGQRWGSGGLIAEDLFLTAGHCFDQYDDGMDGGWSCPKRNGTVITSEVIATYMQVNFDYQLNGVTHQLRTGESFPVLKLLEYRKGGVDYAIVQLGANGAGRLPGDIYTPVKPAFVDVTTQGALLCLIQYPNGDPKKVDIGHVRDNLGGRITYGDLDTLGGSSGALLLSSVGEVVGVHTNGGCTRSGGFNYGVAIGQVRSVSTIVT